MTLRTSQLFSYPFQGKTTSKLVRHRSSLRAQDHQLLELLSAKQLAQENFQRHSHAGDVGLVVRHGSELRLLGLGQQVALVDLDTQSAARDRLGGALEVRVCDEDVSIDYYDRGVVFESRALTVFEDVVELRGHDDGEAVVDNRVGGVVAVLVDQDFGGGGSGHLGEVFSFPSCCLSSWVC